MCIYIYIVNIGKRVKALSLNSPVLLSTEMVKNCSVPMLADSAYFDCIKSDFNLYCQATNVFSLLFVCLSQETDGVLLSHAQRFCGSQETACV